MPAALAQPAPAEDVDDFSDIALGNAMMDRDHADSLGLWREAGAAPDGALAGPFGDFAGHLREHFGREEAEMVRAGFFALHCHQGEHARVLGRIAALEAEIASGDETRARHYLAREFPDWFANHLATMDRVTAGFLASAG